MTLMPKLPAADFIAPGPSRDEWPGIFIAFPSTFHRCVIGLIFMAFNLLVSLAICDVRSTDAGVWLLWPVLASPK